jgi:hypothetical protein
LPPYPSRCRAIAFDNSPSSRAEPPGADTFQHYLNDWLRIKATDGFRTAQVDDWMKDKPRSDPVPRWNLLDALISRANGR